MGHSIGGGALVAGGVAAALLFPWFFQPTDFRRNPALEAAAAVRLVHRYQAHYEDCAAPAPRDRAASLGGLARGFAGLGGYIFPARSDADAVAFAHAARPGCALSQLNRIEWRRRNFFGKPRKDYEPVTIGDAGG